MSATTAFLLTIAALAVAAALGLHRHVITTGCTDDCARLAGIIARFGTATAVLAVAVQTGPRGLLAAAIALAVWAAARLVGVTTYRPITPETVPPEWAAEYARQHAGNGTG